MTLASTSGLTDAEVAQRVADGKSNAVRERATRSVADIVRAAPAHLTERGWCQVLANWVVERGRPWDERLAGWLSPGCDALVVQRELVDPAAYVELWLKDSGHHPTTGGDPVEYRHRYDTWLAWLEEHFPDRAGKVMGIIRSLRAGKDNDPQFFTRMRGAGPWAELIATRFAIACRKHRLVRRSDPLRTDLFRPPAGPQGELF